MLRFGEYDIKCSFWRTSRSRSAAGSDSGRRRRLWNQGFFGAQPTRTIARLICAISGTERMRIGRRTRVHVAADRRLRRVGRFAGCSLSCGAGRCRRIDAPWRGQVGRNNRRADGRRRRRRRRRRRDRQRRNRRCRCGHTRRGGCTQARFRISHRRHWCRQPIEPQQHAAKSNRRHGAVGYKSHRFALGTKDNTQEAP